MDGGLFSPCCWAEICLSRDRKGPSLRLQTGHWVTGPLLEATWIMWWARRKYGELEGHMAELTWQLEGTHRAICWQASAPFDGPSPWTAIPQSITSQLLTGVVKASRSLRVYCSVSTSETGAGLSNQVEYWEAANRPQALISFHWPWCYKVIQFPLAFSICNVTKLLSSHSQGRLVAVMLQSYLVLNGLQRPRRYKVTQFPLAFSGLDVTKLLKKHRRPLSIILLNVFQIWIYYTFLIHKTQKSVTIKLCHKPIIQMCCVNRKKQAT